MKSSKFKSVPIKPSEITPERVYLSRRQFLKAMGIIGGGALLAACVSDSNPTQNPTAGGQPADIPATTVIESDEPLNTFEEITNFNNYYEFTLDKTKVAGLAKDFQTSPWEVEVYGLVENPKTFSL